MTQQISFSSLEQELLHDYRAKMGIAESNEDVKKFFIYNAMELFKQAAEKPVTINYEDIELRFEQAPYFEISDRLLSKSNIAELCNSSDLTNILGRFAETAVKRCKHLKKNPAKTEAKFRN